MKLVYTGPHADLHVPAAEIVFKRGEPTEVEGAIGKELAKRADFERPETPAEAKAREKREALQAEQDAAAAKAADEARKSVAAKQAKNGSVS